MKRFVIPYLMFMVFMAGLAHQAAAQSPNFYPSREPVFSCTDARKDSPMVVTITNAQPEATVWYTLNLKNENLDTKRTPRTSRVTYTSARKLIDDLNLGQLTNVSEIDPSGRCVLTIPLTGVPVGKSMVLKILIMDSGEFEDGHGIEYPFTVENPCLYLSSMVDGSEGYVTFLDELEGDPVRIGPFNGRPGKLRFNRDATNGYVMLDGDRIHVFDNLTMEMNHRPFNTGLGLVDIEVTPDGRKLIALTEGAPSTGLPYSQPGNLWIYDIDGGDLTYLTKCMIDPAAADDAGRIMAISEDSMLVFIRRDDLTIGEYSLPANQFRRFQVGGINHLGGKVRDITVHENCLLVLMAMPDQRAFLHVVNTQTYTTDHSILLGTDPQAIHLYHRPDGRPMAVIHDRNALGNDILYGVDFLTGKVLNAIQIPDIARYMVLSESLNLCMILCRDARLGGDYLRFFDLNSFQFNKKRVDLEHSGEARIYLSRSMGAKSGFVYYQDGTLLQIDLDDGDFPIIRTILLEGPLTGSAVELFGVSFDRGGSGEISE